MRPGQDPTRRCSELRKFSRAGWSRCEATSACLPRHPAVAYLCLVRRLSPLTKSAIMSRYIALLRAINVGRGRTVKMEFVRELFESLGFAKVATFIASGNVMFEATTKNVRLLEKKIGQRLRHALGYEVAVFIRRDTELAAIEKYKPFRQSKINAATEFNVIFLGDPLDEKFEQNVMALRTDTDEFHVQGSEIYWLRRKRPSGSTFSRFPSRRRSVGRSPSAALRQSDRWP
jgi:uncharacterized protein (DUF1697 family)